MNAVAPRQAAAAGGMVNMARGLGTALGVAVVTLTLHAAVHLGHPGAGPAMATVAVAALAATLAGYRAGNHGCGRTGAGLPVPWAGRR